MDMIAGSVLRAGTAHGPLTVLDTLPDGALTLGADGILGAETPVRLAKAVVAVRGAAATRLAALAEAVAAAPVAVRPVAWLVPVGVTPPDGLAGPIVAFDPAVLARLIPCPRASFQPGGRVWLT